MNKKGTFKSFMDDLPLSLIVGVFFICILPIFLNALGFDFATSKTAFDIQGALGMTQIEVVDHMFGSLKGSFVHTILEWSAFCCGVFVAMLAFSHFRLTGSVVTPIIGIALFFAGVMDAFHTLAADRLIHALADNRQLIPFTWAICRLFNGLIICVVMSALLFKSNPLESKSLKKGVFQIVVISIVLGFCAYFIIYWCAHSTTLPQTMFPEAAITRPWDIYPLIIFLLSLFIVFPLFYRKYPSVFSASIVLSVIPDIATQFHMAFGSTNLFDNHFNIAHFLKIISYIVPLLGLIIDYSRTYNIVSRSKSAVEEALKSSEEERIKVQESKKLAEENQRAAENALHVAEIAKKEVEQTNETMLGREEKIIELRQENQRLKKKYGEVG